MMTARIRSTGLRAVFAAALLLLGAAAPGGPAAAGEYVVLVNGGNEHPGGEEARGIVQRLFLKRASEWPDGTGAFPLDRPAASDAHTAFVENVLGTSEGKLQEWWTKLKQQRGATAPRAVGAPSLLTQAIGARAGAFGFAKRSEVAPIPDSVRVLFTFQGP